MALQTYYVFENDAQRLQADRSALLFDTPKSQLSSGLGQFTIEEGYFKPYRFKFLRKYLESSDDQPGEPTTGARSTSSVGEATRGTGEHGSASTSTSSAPSGLARPGEGWTNLHRSCPPACSVDHSRSAVRPVTPRDNDDGITPRKPKGNLAFLPTVDKTADGKPIGLCIAQLGLQSRCIKIGEEHRAVCKEGELRIERDGRMHKGFEVYEVFVCDKCGFRKKNAYVDSKTISTRKRQRVGNREDTITQGLECIRPKEPGALCDNIQERHGIAHPRFELNPFLPS